MLSGSVRILNFDDSVVKQQQIVNRFHPTVVDLKKIGPYCRLWLNKTQIKEIKTVLKPEHKNAITFLGSGDFHHVSGVLVEQFEEPITVIIFDHHPDWDLLPPKLGYGSWVTYILSRPNIKKVLLLGVSSDDISTGSIQTGNLNSLKGNRVEIYPFHHEPTLAFFKKVPTDNACVETENKLFYKKIYWRQLKDLNGTKLFDELLGRIDTKQVYLSIDKDCLKSAYSLTNWEEGCFEIDQFLQLVELIKQNLKIVGLDIIGDYSVSDVRGGIKAFLYRTDHPRHFSARGRTEAEISAINEQTNLRILELLKM